jgi:glycosyltransferase involved in cell wall biosynthesis
MSADSAVEITVIAPVKDEAETLAELYRELCAALEGLHQSFELILVDDGSSDGSFAAMKRLHESDPRVRAVKFPHNFGKAAALAAGFDRARGKIIITIDSDLQDDPAEIPRLLEALENAHLVSGWKKERHDPLTRRASSRVFNFIAGRLAGLQIHDMNCGFKAYRREVTKSLRLYGELHRFIPALAAARGFRVAEVPVRHRPRRHGRSRYGLERVPRGFFDLLTVLFLTSYSRRPLHLFGGIGASLGLAGFASLAYLTCLWLEGVRPIGTRPLFLGGIMLLLLGAQLLSLGLVGELITHASFRSGDQYIVEEEI